MSIVAPVKLQPFTFVIVIVFFRRLLVILCTKLLLYFADIVRLCFVVLSK